MGDWIVVAAGEDVEEASRKLGRLRGVVERAMISKDIDLQSKDLALTSGGDLGVHVVVARK